jgi:hypothetical protein
LGLKRTVASKHQNHYSWTCFFVQAKPLVIAGLPPKEKQARRPKTNKRVRWRDEADPVHCSLVDIRYIERENKGKKICGKDLGPVVLPAKVSRDVSVEDFLRTVLDWMPSWLKEQKRFREPPRVHGELAVHRLECMWLPHPIASDLFRQRTQISRFVPHLKWE